MHPNITAPRICPQCQTPFVSKDHRQRFCSRPCGWVGRRLPSLAERHTALVDTSGGLDACSPWRGNRKAKGYGYLTVHGKKQHAHRIAYELAFGPIPPGLWVLHRCDNPPCCNPRHLVLGTPLDNTDDMMRKRRYGALTHPERQPRGEDHPGAKLTAASVREIRRRYAEGGISYLALSREYGVSPRMIRLVVVREAWRDVA